MKLIFDYAYALDLLDQYDYQRLEITESKRKETFRLSYDEAKGLIDKVKSVYNTTELFGREKDKSFESSISTIYQTHDGQDLYPSLEEKAAHLLYFITKNHSLMEISE